MSTISDIIIISTVMMIILIKVIIIIITIIVIYLKVHPTLYWKNPCNQGRQVQTELRGAVIFILFMFLDTLVIRMVGRSFDLEDFELVSQIF